MVPENVNLIEELKIEFMNYSGATALKNLGEKRKERKKKEEETKKRTGGKIRKGEKMIKNNKKKIIYFVSGGIADLDKI